MRNKMTTLSPETHKIASNMDNFSGWLRARLRQFDEGVDLVEIEMAKDYLRLQMKTITAAIELLFPEYRDEIWEKYQELMAQKKLGDFE